MLKEEKVKKILQSENINISLLRKESWRRLPSSLRGQVWRLLWEYEPSKSRRSNEFLAMKRREYYEMAKKVNTQKRTTTMITSHHPLSPRSSTLEERDIWRQISLDIPRTSPNNPLFKEEWIQEAMTRILYLLSIRRPLTGYVQGMNDLLTPFIWVFYWENEFPSRDEVEADSFWCLCRLIDEVQPNYAPLQSGIIEQIEILEKNIMKEDPILHEHIQKIGLTYLQISFRWFNCLLIREFPINLLVLMWDSYLGEGGPSSFGHKFHPYVCSSFLKKFRSSLLEMDFQDFVTFLQKPQTSSWEEGDIELLMSESFISSKYK